MRSAILGILALGIMAISPSAASAAPSFDCRAANHPAEATICRSWRLSWLDRRLARAYSNARYDIRSTGHRRAYRRFVRDQRRWLRERNRCRHNRRCLVRSYRARIKWLRHGELDYY